MKRGMLSVFIIIGLFLLLAVGLFISIRNGLLPDFLTGSDKITVFTEQCVENLAREGISIMELQGGYIELPQKVLLEKSYLDHGFKVPYWYYEGYDRMPTRSMMEKELSEYVNSNLGTCLDGYRAFPEYEIEPISEMTTSAVISDEEVSVETNYELSIHEIGSEDYSRLESFNAEFDTYFGHLYNLAAELMQHENRYGFLENYTDEMIACSDWLPYEGMEFNCRPMVWRISEMRDYIKTLLMHNLNFLMYERTDFEFSGIPYYDNLYRVDFTRNDYGDVKVKTIYNPDWPMELEVTPSDGYKTEPYEFRIARIINTCMKIFHHKYTLNYPVMFQLSEEGETFYFATPVIMKRGLPNRHNEVLPWASEIDKAGSSHYCANFTKISSWSTVDGTIVTTPALRPNRQYNLRVFAKDALTGAVLPGVNISYRCVKYECDMGTTAYPMSGGFISGTRPMLSTEFPDCIGGFVIAEREGYYQGKTRASVGEDTDNMQVNVPMYPLHDYIYQLKVVENHNNIIRVRDLEEDEVMLITIKNDEMGFEQTILYPDDSGYFTNLSLMVGDFIYDLDIKLIVGEEYVGGLELEWVTDMEQLAAGRFIRFYAVKKDPLYPPNSAEDFQELYEYAIENSPDYPPEII